VGRSPEHESAEQESARTSPSSADRTRETIVGPQKEAGSISGSAVVPEADACSSWQTLLSGSPREVLSRLVQDDPLGVRGQVAERLRADALLLDGDRAHLRALARISRTSGSYRGRPGLSEWVAIAVAESVEELVREMHEQVRRPARSRADGLAKRAGDSTTSSDEARDADAFEILAGPLGLDPGSMRIACAAFDVLPFPDRAAFFDLVLESKDLDACARAAGVNASEIARRARRALDAILGPVPGSRAESRSIPSAKKETEKQVDGPARQARKP